MTVVAKVAAADISSRFRSMMKQPSRRETFGRSARINVTGTVHWTVRAVMQIELPISFVIMMVVYMQERKK
jgi:hypothetical protein